MYKRKKVCEYLPIIQLSLTGKIGKSKKSFFKKMKLSDILKNSCKNFLMKFLEVNNFLRNYLHYFTKKVEQNFMKEFSCEQKKKIQYNL